MLEGSTIGFWILTITIMIAIAIAICTFLITLRKRTHM